MKKKYLPLYKDWMKTGYLPARGLCHSLFNNGRVPNDDLFNIMTPEETFGYWAGFKTADGHEYTYRFNTLRQTITNNGK